MKNGNSMAFPDQDPAGLVVLDAEPGLSKRELFAAMAMQGILSEGSDSVPGEVAKAQDADGATHESVMAAWAREAVGYADALLAALEGSSDE